MPSIIQGLTSDPNQIQPIQLPDGTTLTMTLYWRSQQFGWFYDLSWNGVTPSWLNQGLRLVSGPNVLRQYKNQLPFGLTVSCTDGLDPTGQQDFVDGTCTMLLLDADDVIGIEAVYFPGN